MVFIRNYAATDDDDDFDVCRGPQLATQWSQCSKSRLKAPDVGICLHNVPETYVNAKCGNGIIDAGEQCDCGLAPNSEVVSDTLHVVSHCGNVTSLVYGGSVSHERLHQGCGTEGSWRAYRGPTSSTK